MRMMYMGIFWVKAIIPIDAVVIKSECTATGDFINIPDEKFLSKSRENYNHRLAWQSLDKSITENKPYNYYPRGRVEIRSGKARVFVNENVISEKFEEWIKNEFNLCDIPMRIVADMSNHYLCHFDKEDRNG